MKLGDRSLFQPNSVVISRNTRERGGGAISRFTPCALPTRGYDVWDRVKGLTLRPFFENLPAPTVDVSTLWGLPSGLSIPVDSGDDAGRISKLFRVSPMG
jgi:hypothetical protein